MINDFSAYENLSSYSIKRHHTWSICEENTSYHSKKINFIYRRNP